MNVVTPKFMTPEMVGQVVDMVLNATILNERMKHVFKRQACHVVVLGPAVEDAREAEYPDWPNYPIMPAVIFERSVGKEDWPRNYENIAQCKAQQLWRGQNTEGNTDSVPHLLFPDDTPFWGGVARHGIVVACSGVQPYFDQMVSGMIADGIKAFGRDAFENSDDKRRDRDFLS